MSLNLDLHPAQAQVFSHSSRNKLLIASRRFGKSRLLLTSLIEAALSFDQPIDPASPPVVLAAYPTLKQGRAVLWTPLVNLLENAPCTKQVIHSDFRIKFKGNKPDILLRGTDNDGDGLRGLKLYFAGCDEIQDFTPATLDSVITPALADTPNSKFLGIGTPKGKAHWLYSKLYQKAIASPDWAYFHYTAYDNPYLSRKVIRRAKRDLPDRIFRQEFLAEFTLFAGQIFDCLQDKHIIDILPSEYDDIYIGLDHGPTNPALVVVGRKGPNFYLIDAWTNPHSGQSVTTEVIYETAGRLAKQYNAWRVYSPNDRPDIVLGLQKYGKQRGIPGLKRAVEVKRNNPGPIARAEAANTLFHQDRLYINAKLKEVVDQFNSYRLVTNSAGEVVEAIAPNQNDHVIDATLYVIGRIYKNDVFAKDDILAA